MPESATKKPCPVCGGQMESKDEQEFCPACLLKQGMQPSTYAGNPALQNWTPPTVEQLVDRFPNLDIQTLIGQGGMGAVYKVRQKELDRAAALKILPEAVANDPSFTERFLREARLLASLSHPHIVTVYEFGERDGLYFILMEYVDGVSLRQASDAEPIKRLAPKEALSVVGQLCDALQFAHDEGVVHRDIKPENILLDKRGRVKIADFGLARLLGKPADLPTLTRTHQLMGTPNYMAPEQIEGRPVIDHRADIYSLGVVFYELLTGELPIGRFQAPSEKAEIDARLDEVVFRTLENEPDRRYQQASQVRTDVETIRSSKENSNEDVSKASELQGPRGWTASQFLLLCWTFIGAQTALYFQRVSPTLLQIGISTGVTAIVAILIRSANHSDRHWNKARFATATIVGLLLPAAVIVGGVRQEFQALEQRLTTSRNQERFARNQINKLKQRVSTVPPPVGDRAKLGGFGFHVNRLPQIEITSVADGTANFADSSGNFSAGECETINAILTDIRRRYLKLEAQHSVITVTGDDSYRTTIMRFPDEWQRLENNLWKQLDEAVSLEQQKLLHRSLQLTADGQDSGKSIPKLLGWSHTAPPVVPDSSSPQHGFGGNLSFLYTNLLVSSSSEVQENQPDAPLATVDIRRKGNWFEWQIEYLYSQEPYTQSGPELPDVLKHLWYGEPSPEIALRNAQAAYALEQWETLMDSFTYAGQLDWGLACASNLNMLSEAKLIKPLPEHLRHRYYQTLLSRLSPSEFVRDEVVTNAWISAIAIQRKLADQDAPEQRQQVLTQEVRNLRADVSSFIFLHMATMLQGNVSEKGLDFLLDRNAELTTEPIDEVSSKGTLRLANGTTLPLRFRLVDHNWKIDGIMTPEASLLLMPAETPADETAAEDDGVADSDEDGA